MLIWADGFDHYGTAPNGGRDAMLAGAWASFQGVGTIQISNTQARTGTYSLQISPTTTLAHYARRVLGSAKTTVGLGFGVFMPALPTDNLGWGFAFLDNSADHIVRIFIDTDGSLRAIVGTGVGTLVGVSDPILHAGTWEHIECKLHIDDIVGEIEVRVNGITKLHVTNIDIGTEGTTQITVGRLDNIGSGAGFFFDDIFAWDGLGGVNDDFLGVQRVETLFPDSDGTPMDWTASSGSDEYAMIDDVAPDGDSSYIFAEDTGDKAQFGIEEGLPPETVSIAGVFIPVMAKLEEAGSGTIMVSLISGAEVDNGPVHPLNPTYVYLGSAFQQNPDGDIPWTKATLEAAQVLIEKVL